MTEQPQPAPPPEERPFWKMDRAEQRVLFVTFVGGLASIIVGAVILAIAIALARFAASHQRGGAFPTLLSSLIVALMAGLIIIAGIFLNKTRGPNRLLPWIITGLGIVIVRMAILVIIGVAAGVK